MRLTGLVALLACLVLSSACKPSMRYGYSRDAHVSSEYLLVRTPPTGERIESRGVGPERLRMHLYDPFEANVLSSSKVFYVDLGPECRLMATREADRYDSGDFASGDFIQAEAHFVAGKRCALTLDTGLTVEGIVQSGVMVIRPSSTTLDVSLALEDGTLRLAMIGPWQPPRERT